jgi:hypothetical protein
VCSVQVGLQRVVPCCLQLSCGLICNRCTLQIVNVGFSWFTSNVSSLWLWIGKWLPLLRELFYLMLAEKGTILNWCSLFPSFLFFASLNVFQFPRLKLLYKQLVWLTNFDIRFRGGKLIQWTWISYIVNIIIQKRSKVNIVVSETITDKTMLYILKRCLLKEIGYYDRPHLSSAPCLTWLGAHAPA